MAEAGEELHRLFTAQGGRFFQQPSAILSTLQKVRVFLFDWDGVFTPGRKDIHRNSSFSELDTMGINMLRLSWFLRTGEIPFTAIITGEENPGAMLIAERDHFDAVYYQVKNKSLMPARLMSDFGVDTSTALFFFDDILDLSLVRKCALAFALSNPAALLFRQHIEQEPKCAYLSANSGGHHGIREITEMLIGLFEGLNGNYTQTIQHRTNFDDVYRRYLALRNQIKPSLFSFAPGE